MVGSIQTILKQACVKWQREERLQTMRGLLSREVGQHDVEIAAELPQDLAARAARRRERRRVGDNRDAREGAMSFGESLEHRHALRANRQSVRRVLDVAAGDD